MASKYKWGQNPIHDYFVQNLIDNVDLSKKRVLEEVSENLISFITHFLGDENDIKYLDFQVKRDKFDGYSVVANNFITGLWFSGVVPTDIERVISDGNLVFNNKEYTYNKKTKKIKIKKL